MGIVQDPYRHYTGTQDRAVFTSRFDTPIYGSGVFLSFHFHGGIIPAMQQTVNSLTAQASAAATRAFWEPAMA
jgi:hypothetical protein